MHNQARAARIIPAPATRDIPGHALNTLNRLEAHSETTVMIGDRMDTDIKSGLEAGLRTVLVLTGSTRPEDVERYPYRPSRIVDSIADVVELVSSLAPL